jgi:hypothetical protein
LGHPGPDDRLDDLHGEEYNDTKTQDHLKSEKRFVILKPRGSMGSGLRYVRQPVTRWQNQHLWGGNRDAVPHRAEVQGNDQLDDVLTEEGLCPGMPDVSKLMVEEVEKEWNFDNQCRAINADIP